MCGICGWADFGRDLSGESAIADAMTDTLCCRGPDARGTWLDPHAVLGHRRLAVIDLEGGRQPMARVRGGRTQAVLSFCGEVYNFQELRRELAARGHVFDTRSDTEVVLASYLEWGAGFPGHLRGMFAVAVWDPRRRELLLARDRLGVKPLYYQRTAEGLVFGSEPKAILAHPLGSRRVSAEGLCEILEMVKTPERTAYSGMNEVRPGQLVRLTESGLRTSRYWELTAHEHVDDLPATVDTVRGLLEQTVSEQMVTDVPLCSLLSGGLDSSVITALAASRTGLAGLGPLRTFSVDFGNPSAGFSPDAVRGEPDTPFARDLVAKVGARHAEVVLDSAELSRPGVRAAVLGAVDQPPGYWGDMWASLYLLFREVRRTSTVALSGESADELFGGYQWFRNPSAVTAHTFPWLTSGSVRYFGGAGLLDRGLLEKLDLAGYRADRYQEAVSEAPELPGESAVERRMRQITYLNLTRFVQTLLDRKDRMSMAVGLEVRVPFCDHRLVDYVFNVPWAMKSFDGREKSLLRAAFEDILPASIVRRVKTPYPAVQDPGYERALRAGLAEVVADRAAPVRPLLDMDRARRAAARRVGEVSRPYDRGGLEMALWLNDWLARYDIALDL
ncbi:asparagine synthase (glutamine-hydrolyzing) [Amycolatopsis rubida]|uniref:asparagine synthase (glutamine-hydrolyzing) n=1 Tax=Amycolatopsis rubida TaxID=112413 RepID=A0ABX0C5B7_9PSEU|nr:asparagine synthase (glutamine-hydrolyzing) [Amycolatopsis sp. M39]MYW97970.1 asparagine synthase (glutamine-hydrolyzing) [Amycolatopsis rubida]NEC62955.1 asparagine synthase (glutamine-hydrolyzing) [Amycolatopsis rubida]OAP22623.1 Asparagine synthetase [glutamine-hydrolyzing] 3 [Amycolatopsis sp. M39]